MKLAPNDGRIAGSKMQAVRIWFAANPHEYLTYEDLRTRFDLNVSQTKSIAYTLRAEGLIDSAVMLFKVPGA